MKKEVKIGIAGIAALVILFFGIKFLKGVNLFTDHQTYYLQFTDIKGLTRSSAVYADGYKVGIVSEIEYDYDHPGNVFIEISTNKDLRIPKGSSACISEGILGGSTLNMLLVNNLTEAYAPGDTIMGQDASGLMAKAGEMMPQVEGVVSKVDSLLISLNRLAADSSLVHILQNVEYMTVNLNQSSAELQKLLANDVPHLTSTYGKAGDNIVALTDKVNQIELKQTIDSINVAIGTATEAIRSANQLIAQLQSNEGTLGQLMNSTELIDNLNHTVQSADSLVTDLKANPKRYVHFSVFGKKDK